MKTILFSALFALFVCSLSAQTNNIWQSGGISQTVGAPTYKPGAKGNIVAIDTVTGIWYVSRDRYAANGNWLSMGQRIEQISGCSAPAYTPNKYNSDLVINNCAVPELYYHSGGGVWVQLNASGSTYTAGTGIAISGSNVISNTAPDQTVAITGGGINSVSGTYPSFTVTGTEVDGSTSNELQTLSVGSGTTTLSNSGGSMTIAGAGINSVGTAGTTITITGTEVDGSTTNELQTIANTSDATSHTVTLSNSGGSTQLVEGSNITLTTTGTSGAGIVTIAATGGATDLSISGSSSPLTINSSTGTDVTVTAGTGISLAGTSGDITITNTSPSLWTDGGATSYLTATGDNVAIGATSAGSKLDIITNSLGTTQTNTSGLLLSNTTAAAAGAQQISPAIRWRGNGWKTTATAASQTIDFRQHLLPIQGTTAPSGALLFDYSINGGAYAELARLTTTGRLGIGTSSPATALHVKSPSGSNDNATFEWTTTPGGASAKMVIDAIWNDRVRFSPVTTGSEAGTLIFCNSTSQSFQFIDSNREIAFSPFNITLKGYSTGAGSVSQQTTVVPWSVRGTGGQTASLQQWQNSSGTVLSSVDASGKVAIGSASAPSDYLEVTGNVSLKTAGNKLKIATGSNASIGTSTLVAGTVTVSTTAVATGSIIIVSCNTPGGTQGILSAPVASITNATSFIINSSNAADTSTVNWWIIN